MTDPHAQRIARARAHHPTHHAICDTLAIEPDTGFLERVAARMAPPDWLQGNTSLPDVLFLASFVRAVRPRTIIDIGTAGGGSASALLLALDECSLIEQGSRVRTFDQHEWCFFERSKRVGSAIADIAPDLAHACDVHINQTALDAHQFASRAQLAFIDGEHRHPGPLADVLALSTILEPRSWVVLHDIILPTIAKRTGNDWLEHGASHLFGHWPGEKLAGLENGEPVGGANIGAIRLPDSPATLRDWLRPIASLPFEYEPDERTSALLATLTPAAAA